MYNSGGLQYVINNGICVCFGKTIDDGTWKSVYFPISYTNPPCISLALQTPTENHATGGSAPMTLQKVKISYFVFGIQNGVGWKGFYISFGY